MNKYETGEERVTYPSNRELLDTARLREQAALEQARLARESLAAMAERLQATEHLYAKCRAQLDAAELVINGMSSGRVEHMLMTKLAVAEARAAELERERDEAQAHAARLTECVQSWVDLNSPTLFGDVQAIISASPAESLARLRALEEEHEAGRVLSTLMHQKTVRVEYAYEFAKAEIEWREKCAAVKTARAGKD